MESISARIRIALDCRDMSANELSLKTKINKSSISRYLSGAYEPKYNAIAKMSQVLRVQPAWLMGYDVPMEPDDEPESLDLSRDEVALVGRYRGLDLLGKQMVNHILEMEYKRCMEQAADAALGKAE